MVKKGKVHLINGLLSFQGFSGLAEDFDNGVLPHRITNAQDVEDPESYE